MIFKKILKTILSLSTVLVLPVMTAWGYPGENTRIVSLTPHITEILFSIGGGEYVAGTPSAYDNAHPSIPTIGEYSNPSVEKIISLKPTLIIGSSASARPELVNKLTKLGYRVELTGEQSLSEIYDSILTIGKLCGRGENAADTVNKMRSGFGRVERSISGKPYKTVLYQVWEQPLITVGKGSYLTEILIKTHLNPVALKKGGYNRVSIEEVLDADPDVILIPYNKQMKISPETLVSMWAKYPQLKAVKNKEVYIISDTNLHLPGPSLVAGMSEIAEVVWGIK